MQSDRFSRSRWCAVWLGAAALCASCHAHNPDPRYPSRPEGCEVKIFKGPVPSAIAFDKLGRIDAICGYAVSEAECMRVLRNQACKLGGDLIYDLPPEPEQPSPDKVKWDARVGHTRIRTTTSP